VHTQDLTPQHAALAGTWVKRGRRPVTALKGRVAKRYVEGWKRDRRSTLESDPDQENFGSLGFDDCGGKPAAIPRPNWGAWMETSCERSVHWRTRIEWQCLCHVHQSRNSRKNWGTRLRGGVEWHQLAPSESPLLVSGKAGAQRLGQSPSSDWRESFAACPKLVKLVWRRHPRLGIPMKVTQGGSAGISSERSDASGRQRSSEAANFYNVLFLCTDNSIHSVMAEAIRRYEGWSRTQEAVLSTRP
jgi:hypothetical protein